MTSEAEATGELLQDLARTTAQLRARHDQETSPLQGAVDRVTGLVGRPGFAAGLGAAFMGWIGANLVSARLAGWAPDPPPFEWLQGMSTSIALFVAVLILTTQRRENLLAGHREQLILELSILNEQKISKIIELIEEVRRDNPAIRDRVDHEANAMSTPSDTHAVMDAIKDTHEEADMRMPVG